MTPPYLASPEFCEFDAEDHAYFFNGEPVPLYVSRVLELAGISKPYPEAARNHVEHRREIGELTHAWARHFDELEKGKDPGIEDLEGAEILPYVLAYQKFRTDYCPIWRHIEESFHRDGIAGTPDRIGWVGDETLKPMIVDIKTASQPATYWPIQLTGYQWLSRYEDYGLYVVWLTEDADYKLLNYSSHLDVWQGAIAVARWQQLGRK